MKNIQKRLRAFTILELLVVVVIIGIISAVVLAKFGNVKEAAYIDAMKNDLRNLANAQEFYHESKGTYSEATSLPGFYFTDGVEVNSSSATTEEWSVVLKHDKTTHTCAITGGRSLEATNKIKCTNDQGGSGGDDGAEANQSPTALFEVVYCTGLVCGFSDKSTDEDGTIQLWDWDFAGEGTSTEANPVFAFPSGGSYTVNLMVTDDNGGWGVAADVVTVTQPEPLAEGQMWYTKNGQNGLYYRDMSDFTTEHLVPGTDGYNYARVKVDEGRGRILASTSGSSSVIHLYDMSGTLLSNITKGWTQSVAFDHQRGYWLYTEAYDDDISYGSSDNLSSTVGRVYDAGSGAGPTFMALDEADERIAYIRDDLNQLKVAENYTSGGTPTVIASGVRKVHPAIDPSTDRIFYVPTDQSQLRSIMPDGSGDQPFLFAENGRQIEWAVDVTGSNLWVVDSDGAGSKRLLQVDLGSASVLNAFSLSSVESPWDIANGAAAGPGVSEKEAPDVGFSAECQDLVCTFTDTSTDPDGGSILAQVWDFGDGNTASGAVHTYTFTNGGTHLVTLTVTDDEGVQGTLTKEVVTAAPAGSATGKLWYTKGTAEPGIFYRDFQNFGTEQKLALSSEYAFIRVRVDRKNKRIITQTGDQGSIAYLYDMDGALLSSRSSSYIQSVAFDPLRGLWFYTEAMNDDIFMGRYDNLNSIDHRIYDAGSGAGPTYVTVDAADETLAYIRNDTGELKVVDGYLTKTAGTVIKSGIFGGHPMIDPASNRIFYIPGDRTEVRSIMPDGSGDTTFMVMEDGYQAARAIAVTGNDLWVVAGGATQRIYRVSLADGSVLHSVDLPSGAAWDVTEN